MEVALGIDVGGTSIKAGVFSTEGELLAECSVRTPALDNEAAYAVVTEGLTSLLSDNGLAPNDVVALGLDVPAPVDSEGRLGFVPNMTLDGDGLRGAIGLAFPFATIAFVNDANAAALGEMWAGAAAGVRDCVMLALGTGVGAGVIVGGRLVAGAFGAGGEAGHITVNPGETRVCGCGRRGCLEQYASAKGIVHRYLQECESAGVMPAKLEHATDTLGVFGALDAGDPCARRAVDAMCERLGQAMAQISCVVDPELYLIGGGVAGAFETFGPELRRRFAEHALPPCKAARIEPAALGNRAAMYGSANEALRRRAEA